MNDVETLTTAPKGRTLNVRFVPVVGGSEKSPKFRALLHLDGALTGSIMDIPIFQDGKTGKFTVKGGFTGSFPVLKPEPKTIEHDGHTVALAEPSDDGLRLMSSWESQILTAFYAYQGTKVAIQNITF